MKVTRKIFTFLLIIYIEIANILTLNALAASNGTIANQAVKKDKKYSADFKWPKGPSITAEAAILMDVNTGTILFEKNPHKQLYPASITKIMTTLLALENSNLSDTVTYSKSAIYNLRYDSSKIYANVGEKLTVEQSLYGIMLASAGDCSNGIAEHVSGSIEAFAGLMNKKAEDLGCQNTHFVNPHGMPDNNHYTSAYDMALITKAALQYEQFRKIAGAKKYTIPPTNLQKESRYLTNHHKMLIKSNYTYEGCEGGKTGYTVASGYTLVTYAKRGDMELLCVILKDAATEHYTDTAKLFDWGFENFKSLNISSYLSENQLSNYTLFDKAALKADDGADYVIEIDKNSSILIPKTASFDDLKPTFTKNYNKDTSIPSIRTISYTFSGKEVGSVAVNFIKISNSVEDNYNNLDNAEISIKNSVSDVNYNKKRSISFIKIGLTIFVVTIFVSVTYLIIKKRK